MNSKSNKNIWTLNNIAPLEYCSLTRATKLLNCEIEDLLHWHDIGVIDLCIKIEKTKGNLTIKIDNYSEDPFELYFNEILTFNELTRIKNIWSRHSKVFNLITLENKTPQPTIKVDDSVATYELRVYASDIWSINSRNLTVLLDDGECPYIATDVIAINPASYIISCKFFPEMDERPVVNLKNIHITKETIDKIYSHSVSGIPIPFIEGSNNSEYDENKNQKSILPQKEKLSDFIRFLIQSNPSLSKQVLSTSANNRHKIFKDYLSELKSKGIEMDYDIPSSPTLERYLKL